MERYASPRYRRNANLHPAPSSKANPPMEVNTKTEINSEIPPGFAYASPTQANPLPIILLILFASPYIKIDKASPMVMDNSVNNSFEESDTVLDVLSSIHPYLAPELQDRINFVFGLSEARDILKSLFDGTYHTSRIFNIVEQPTNSQERAIGIIKSLQPYISLENQTLINRVLDVNSTVEKLKKSMHKFNQQDVGIEGIKRNNVSKVMEIIDIVKILVPAEQQHNINQISGMLKVVEALEVAQLLNTPNIASIAPKSTANAMISEKDRPPAIDKESTSTQEIIADNKTENISNALKSMLNPEQAKSIDLIMKMAQLFTQNSEEDSSAG